MSDVKTGRREKYAALTRAAVLEAAQTLFVRDGFDETSVEDIARASESSKGAVYHHFRDKQEIFAEVFRASQAEVMHAAVGAMKGDQAPWPRIEAATREFLRGYVANDPARALLRQVMGVLGWDRAREIDEEVALPLIRTAIESAIRSGDIDETLPIDTAADLLFSLYCNTVLLIAAAPDPARAARESESIVFDMLNGLRTGTDRQASQSG